MKALAPIVLAIAAFLMGWLFFGCSQYPIKGSLTYGGRYGDYSISSDGKAVSYDIKLKDPKGFAK